mmetsp:Transcript_40118/g.35412  ORF Transcript_40118/g.35412 Transcript_40118/m.35412 type:complete len:218 (+) Transcript_40118:60-713(+)
MLLVSLLAVANAEDSVPLTCDGYVYEFFSREATPSGVCVASNNGSDTSTIALCSADGDIIEKTYNNLDCTGSESDTDDYACFLSCVPYCDLGGCDYFVERTYYNAMNCSGDVPIGDEDLFYDEKAHVFGYCENNLFAFVVFENNGTHVLRNQYTISDCSGEPDSVYVEGKIGDSCEDYWGNVEAKQIRVGTATETADANILLPGVAVFIAVIKAMIF